MALFSSDNKKTVVKAKRDKAEKPAVKRAPTTLKNTNGRLSSAIKAPWFSEKALIGTERGVYVFEVPGDATKPEIAAAIELTYKVVPLKVRVANLPAKSKALRTRRGVGTRARRHKAYVYLSKGDTLNLV